MAIGQSCWKASFKAPRFKGTSYKAANWICVGQTQGRGKLEKQHRQACALKQIWLYPLHRHFRKILCANLP
jgi:hypothetical protein